VLFVPVAEQGLASYAPPSTGLPGLLSAGFAPIVRGPVDWLQRYALAMRLTADGRERASKVEAQSSPVGMFRFAKLFSSCTSSDVQGSRIWRLYFG
jgi:hypothetical protein